MNSKMEQAPRVGLRSVAKRFPLLFLSVALLAGGILALFFYKDVSEEKAIIEGTERDHINHQVGTIAQDFKLATSDLMFLSEANELKEFLESGQASWRKELAKEWVAFSANKGLYDQIRFLDETGMEVVRVNYNEGNPNVVPDEQLQSKAERYYFKDTFALGQGEVFVSPFDLNIEGGEIEQPLKPTIRFGTPVFDHSGRKRGIVVLNYRGVNLIRDLETFPTTYGHTTYGQFILLNSDGFYLKGLKPEDEWGFMFSDRSDRRFGNDFSEAWRAISATESGQFYNSDGVFTFTTVSRFWESQKSTLEPSTERIEMEGYYWKLVSYVPADVLNARTGATLSRLLMIYGSVLALLGAGSWVLAYAYVRRQLTEKMLQDSVEELRQRQAEISALLEASRAVLEHREFAGAARVIFDSCKNLIGATAGYVALLSVDGTENEVLFLDSGGLPCTVSSYLPMPIRGLRGEVYRTGKVGYDNNFSHSQWMQFMPEGHVSLDNVMFAPLTNEGKTVGLLGLANKPGGFTEDDARVAMAFGEFTAIALSNSWTLETLVESEERFRAVTQTATDAIITADSRGNIVLWNRGAETMFGYSAEEAVGKSLTLIMPERFHEAHKNAFNQAVLMGELKTASKTFEVVGLRKDNSEFPAELSLAKWETSDEVFFTSILRNITERKQAEAVAKEKVRLETEVIEHKKSEEKIQRSYQVQAVLNNLLHFSLENIPLAYLLEKALDEVLSVQWITFQSRGALFLVEDEPDMLVMKAQRGLATPILTTCARVPFGRCLCGRAALSRKIEFADCIDERHENRYEGIIPHGHYCAPIMSGGKVLGVLNLYLQEGHRRNENEEEFVIAVANVLAGIIERKQTEEALKKSEERYRALFESTREGIVASGPDGRIIAANPAVAAMLGYDSPEELMGKPTLELYTEPEQRRALFEVLMQKGYEENRELTLRKKDGAMIYILGSATIHRDKEGNILRTEVVFTDITERKQAERLEAEATVAKLANKAKSEFLASMSHELRTPLNTIIGFAQVLQERYFGELSQKQAEYVNDILGSGKHLLSLINDILDLSKIEAGKEELELSTVNISDLLENSLVIIQEKSLKHGISLNLRTAKDINDLEIKADERKLKQIMFNLLSNAAKFTPDGGAITVEGKKEGKELIISVVDTGIGIAPEHQEKIFEEFYQVKGSTVDKTPGTGLGLPLTKRLVELHSGRIWVESQGLGRGSRFTFTLPIHSKGDASSPKRKQKHS